MTTYIQKLDNYKVDSNYLENLLLDGKPYFRDSDLFKYGACYEVVRVKTKFNKKNSTYTSEIIDNTTRYSGKFLRKIIIRQPNKNFSIVYFENKEGQESIEIIPDNKLGSIRYRRVPCIDTLATRQLGYYSSNRKNIREIGFNQPDINKKIQSYLEPQWGGETNYYYLYKKYKYLVKTNR